MCLKSSPVYLRTCLLCYHVTEGVTGEDEKWRYCVEDAGGSVSFAVGAMYVRETFHGDSKASVSSKLLHSLSFTLPCSSVLALREKIAGWNFYCLDALLGTKPSVEVLMASYQCDMSSKKFLLSCYFTVYKLRAVLYFIPSVLWHCWLGGRKGIRPVKKLEWWVAGVVICLEQGADLHMAQLMPLPLTVSCFSKIHIGFTFLVPANPGSPGKRAVKRVCVCVCVCVSVCVC